MDGPSLLARAGELRADGWRLALINATSILPDEALPEGAWDLAWMFASNGETVTIRERVLPGEAVPSLSGLYGGAFLYENELHELFGIAITGLETDLGGQLYQTAERVPFSPRAIRARIERARGTEPAKRPAHGAGPGTGA